jgi:hypothetical protein
MLTSINKSHHACRHGAVRAAHAIGAGVVGHWLCGCRQFALHECNNPGVRHEVSGAWSAARRKLLMSGMTAAKGVAGPGVARDHDRLRQRSVRVEQKAWQTFCRNRPLRRAFGRRAWVRRTCSFRTARAGARRRRQTLAAPAVAAPAAATRTIGRAARRWTAS